MTSDLMDLGENVETSRLQTPGTNSDTTHTEGMGNPTGKLSKFRISSWNVSGMKDDSIDNLVFNYVGYVKIGMPYLYKKAPGQKSLP